jgi:WD40 repeat protein
VLLDVNLENNCRRNLRRRCVRLLLAIGVTLFAAEAATAAESGATRAAALRVIERGGYVVGIVDSRRRTIRSADEMPTGPWKIWEVFLRRTQVTDDDMAVIAKAPAIERMYVSDTGLTDVGVRHLAEIKSLRDIDLKSTRTTDAGVAFLAELKLTTLSLYDTEVTDEALKTVSRMPTLLSLRLENNPTLTDAGLAQLAKLPKLEQVTTTNTRLTDAGVAELAKIGTLKRLICNYCDLTDAAIPHIARLKNLTHCNLNQTYVTAAGRDALKAALPKCEVAWSANNVRKTSPPKMPADVAKGSSRPARTTASTVPQLPPAVAGPSGITVVGARTFQPTAIESLCKQELPAFLRGAVVFAYRAERKNSPEFGEITVKVDRDMPLMFAATWDDADQDSTEDWAKRRTLYYRLIRAGWIYLGPLDVGEPAKGRQSIFYRQVKAGEELTLQTRRTMPPLVLVPSAAAPSPPIADPYAEWPAKKAELTLTTAWQQLLRSEKFDELETIIAQIRRDRPRDSHGKSRLSVFYDGTAAMAQTDQEFEEDIALFGRWLAAKPKSVAAHLALARAWKSYGWRARGSGFAHTVSEDGFVKFRERIEKSYELTERAVELEEKDPYLYRVKLELAVDRGQPASDVTTFVERSLAIDPDYLAVPLEAVRYFLPRWHGEPGDLEKFIEQTTEGTRDRWGESFYALAVMETTQFHSSDIFEDFKFSWPRVKQGCADLRARYPGSVSYAQFNLRFAGYNRDRAEAKAAADHLATILPAGEKNDSQTERWRRWAQDTYLQGDQTAVYDVMRYPLNHLDWTLDGKTWIALDNEGELRVFEAATGRQTAYVEAGLRQPRFGAVVPFTKNLVTAGWDGAVARINWSTRETLQLGKHENITAAALSTDGGEWATVGRDRKIRFWSVDAKKEGEALTAEWDLSPLTPTSIAYVPDSRTIAIAGDDKTIGFYNIDTRQKSAELTPRKSTVRKMRISSDGRWMAVVDDREITLWRIREFELHATIPRPELYPTDIAISRDGKFLAAATGLRTEEERDHPVVVWNTSDGSVLHTFHGHKAIVRSVCFSPDGSLLASGADDLTIRVWKVK